GPAYDFEDEVALQYYKVQKTFDGHIALRPGVGGTVSGPVAVGTAGKHDKTAGLSQIIDRLNQRFGTNFKQSDQLFFDQVERPRWKTKTSSRRPRSIPWGISP
ncbi:MAG TPA: hypothetical protein VNY05_33795, partial [Candidatus Acidoferrales bacterium]|nr:hypothetical protein [Candidatus Acidoferrales bacterium]